jgi:DNA-binding transcriptional LysR family regulator
MTAPAPLAALRAFEATVRLGGVGHAARSLGVTHGAVSRQLAALQSRLGMPLFDGPRNARRPTAEALGLFAEITAPLAALNRAVASRTHPTARVVVSCLSTLAARWLIPRLPDFAAREPHVRVELRESYAALDQGLDGCDLAIRMLGRDQPAPPGLTAHRFMANASGPVQAPFLVERPPPRLVSRSHPQAWDAWPTTDRAAPLAFDHQQTMIEAAIAGLGVCIAQRSLVEADLAAGRLIAPQGFTEDGAAFTAFHAAGPISAPIRRLVAWLMEQGASSAIG